MSCSVCGKRGKLFHCARCGTKYCSKQHQRGDWPKHKLVCRKTNPATEEPPLLLDLNDFISITPELLGATPGTIAARASTPTVEFYKSLGNTKLHNGGKLPPASSTFPRPPSPLVYVLHCQPLGNTKQVSGWKYFHARNHRLNPAPPRIPTNAHVIILLRPGQYAGEYIQSFENIENARRVEIIGDSPNPKDAVLRVTKNFSSQEEYGFLAANNHVRFCNLAALGPMCDVGLAQAETVELDGIIANDELEDTDRDEYPDALVHAKSYVLLRDCTFTYAGPVVTTGVGRIYAIHCTFTDCGKQEEWQYFDPFVNSPLIRMDHFAHAMLACCYADKTNRGHTLHRNSPSIESVSQEALLELFEITGANPEEAMARMKAHADKLPGITVLHNNRFEQPTCADCDTKIFRNVERRGLHCLKNQMVTNTHVQRRKDIATMNLLERRSNAFTGSLPKNSSEFMVKSVERWNLQPPYCLEVDWKVYWNFRDRIESRDCVQKGEKEIAWPAEFKFPNEMHPKSYPQCAAQQAASEAVDSMGILPWTPDTHSTYPLYFRNTVRTLLLCFQRLKNTHPEQEVWGNISMQVLKPLFTHLMGPLPKQQLIKSIYPLQCSVVHSAGRMGAYSFQGFVFSPVGNGLALQYNLMYWKADKMTGAPRSYLDVALFTPHKTTWSCELFRKDHSARRRVERRRTADEDKIKVVSQCLMGVHRVLTSQIFQFIFAASGATVFKTDEWALPHAQKKSLNSLLNAEVRRFMGSESLPGLLGREGEDNEEDDESDGGDDEFSDEEYGIDPLRPWIPNLSPFNK